MTDYQKQWVEKNRNKEYWVFYLSFLALLVYSAILYNHLYPEFASEWMKTLMRAKWGFVAFTLILWMAVDGGNSLVMKELKGINSLWTKHTDKVELIDKHKDAIASILHTSFFSYVLMLIPIASVLVLYAADCYTSGTLVAISWICISIEVEIFKKFVKDKILKYIVPENELVDLVTTN